MRQIEEKRFSVVEESSWRVGRTFEGRLFGTEEGWNEGGGGKEFQNAEEEDKATAITVRIYILSYQ